MDSEGTDIEYALKRSLVSRNKLAIILKTATGETEYCCVECSAKYNDKEKLEMHLCMHNNQYRFLCGICGTGLKRKEHLDRHTLEHTEVRPHKCPQCSKGFKRKEHLNIHMSIHKGEKDKICTLCNRSFNRKDHLQKHLQTHTKMFTEQNLYPLDDQEMMEMKQEEEFIGIQGDEYIQMKEEVDEDVKPYIPDDSYMEYEMECSDPQESSEYNDGSNADVDQSVDIRTPDSQNNVRPFMCPICYKSYKRRDHLKIHSWTHMKKEKICSGCGKAFHKDVQLAAHMHLCLQVHAQHRAELEEGRFDANDSGEYESLGSDNSLLVEMGAPRIRMEQESRPHECPICNRRFKRKQHLKVHANVHRKQESIWCSRCNEGFLSNAQFEQHECGSLQAGDAEYEHILPTSAPSGRKENNYPGAGEMFMQEMLEESGSELYGSGAEGAEGVEGSEGVEAVEALADEQNIPVPVRVFVCRFCQKAFKRRDHYKIHLHIHTGVKDFFCPDCGKGFYRKDHLQKHAQTHFKHKPPPKPKKQLPGLVPLAMMPRRLPEPELVTPKNNPQVKPEITITAPSNAKLRVPLQMKVAYQVVTRPAREP